MTAIRHCLCGASSRIRGALGVEERLVAKFEEWHSGEGHGPATADQAAAVRRREERALIPREDV